MPANTQTITTAAVNVGDTIFRVQHGEFCTDLLFEEGALVLSITEEGERRRFRSAGVSLLVHDCADVTVVRARRDHRVMTTNGDWISDTPLTREQAHRFADQYNDNVEKGPAPYRFGRGYVAVKLTRADESAYTTA